MFTSQPTVAVGRRSRRLFTKLQSTLKKRSSSNPRKVVPYGKDLVDDDGVRQLRLESGDKVDFLRKTPAP